jgi:ribosome-binding protein aMBF1 (putative translation factor)
MFNNRGENRPPFSRSMPVLRSSIQSFDGRKRIDMLVGHRVATKRRECGLSLEAVAAAIRVPPDWLASYESGDERVLPNHICMLAKLFRVTPGFFFEEF